MTALSCNWNQLYHCPFINILLSRQNVPRSWTGPYGTEFPDGAFTEYNRDERHEMRNLLGPWKQGQPKLKMCSDLYRGQGTVVSPFRTPQPTIKATQVCFGYDHITKHGGKLKPLFFSINTIVKSGKGWFFFRWSAELYISNNKFILFVVV